MLGMKLCASKKMCPFVSKSKQFGVLYQINFLVLETVCLDNGPNLYISNVKEGMGVDIHELGADGWGEGAYACGGGHGNRSCSSSLPGTRFSFYWSACIR